MATENHPQANKQYRAKRSIVANRELPEEGGREPEIAGK
jgi:hypothetical protein